VDNYVKGDIVEVVYAADHASLRVLASLAQERRSGYDIAQWFAYVTKHFCAFGHSSVYPTLADLEQRGLVTFTETPSEQGPTRKVYEPTRLAARRCWHGWMCLPATPRYADEQLLKALCYASCRRSGPSSCCASHGRVTRAPEKYETLVRAAEADMRADDPQIAAAALGRSLTGRRGVGSQESYVAWCDEQSPRSRHSRPRFRPDQRTRATGHEMDRGHALVAL